MGYQKIILQPNDIHTFIGCSSVGRLTNYKREEVSERKSTLNKVALATSGSESLEDSLENHLLV